MASIDHHHGALIFPIFLHGWLFIVTKPCIPGVEGEVLDKTQISAPFLI
jgi:hypothetical protein